MSKDEEIKVIDEFIEKIAPYITQSPAIAEEIKALIHFYEKTGQKLTPVPDMTEAERQAIWKRLEKQMESKPALQRSFVVQGLNPPILGMAYAHQRNGMLSLFLKIT